jgi:hypothetical protein
MEEEPRKPAPAVEKNLLPKPPEQKKKNPPPNAPQEMPSPQTPLGSHISAPIVITDVAANDTIKPMSNIRRG